MLGLKLNHVSKRGHWCPIYASVNRVRIASDNGLSPIRFQAIIWTNARIMLTEPLVTKFSEIFIQI